MDTLMIKIAADKAATRQRISQLNADMNAQAEKIRNAAANAAPVEMLRQLPPMLEDLKVDNSWLHNEQEKLAVLEGYVGRQQRVDNLADDISKLSDEECKSVIAYARFLKSQR